MQVTPNTYYIDCPAKIGVYLTGKDEAWLIDSGNDKEAGKKVCKILAANGWQARAVINTHSNADHIGGNRLLAERTGCALYAFGMERAFTQYPVLEPSFLYGGYPCAKLRNKFLMAQPSNALELTAEVLPPGLEIIRLEGHFFDMIGLKTADDVYFLADCISGENILEKYHVGFIYDVREYLKTLDYVEALPGKYFIPAHAAACADVAPLVRANRRKVEEIIARLLEICREPACFEDILGKVFAIYDLRMDFNQYVLVGSTVRSYLSYLYDEGKVAADFASNKLIWSSKS